MDTLSESWRSTCMIEPHYRRSRSIMFTNGRKRLVWVALFGLIIGAHAQSDRRGSVSGVVSSSSGTPMLNVTVVIQNLDTNVKQQTATDASGNYRFDGVEP